MKPEQRIFVSIAKQIGQKQGKWQILQLNDTDQNVLRAIMQNMIFDSIFEVDSVLENKSDF